MATLVRYTGLSERTVCTCLDRLQARGVISPCDPGHRRGAIKRADRRPHGWDLNLGMIRQALAQAGLAAPERQFPGLAARIATASPPGTDDGTGGAQPPHPASGNGEPVDKVPGEVQQVHVVRHVAPDKAFVLFAGVHMRYLFPRVFATTPAGHIRRDQRQLPADGARTGTDAAGRRMRLRALAIPGLRRSGRADLRPGHRGPELLARRTRAEATGSNAIRRPAVRPASAMRHAPVSHHGG